MHTTYYLINHETKDEVIYYGLESHVVEKIKSLMEHQGYGGSSYNAESLEAAKRKALELAKNHRKASCIYVNGENHEKI